MPSSLELLASRAGRNIAGWARQATLARAPREPRDGVDVEKAARQMVAARATIIAVYSELGLLTDEDEDVVRAATTEKPYPGLAAQLSEVPPGLAARAEALLRD